MSDLYDEVQMAPMIGEGMGINPLMTLNLGGPVNTPLNLGGQMNGSPARKEWYSEILSQLRLVMISRMAKPEEVSCARLWLRLIHY